MGGHSYGGATATLSTHIDKRIKSCLVLDSWVSPLPESVIDTGIHVPFLFMGRPSWENSDYPGNYSILDSLIAHSSEPKYQLVIQDTEHLDYTDIPLFSPIVKYVLEVGSLSPSISLPMINKIVFSFLDKELNKASGSDLKQFLSNNLISDL